MGFGAPLLLIGLFTLPAIWFLLRVTPPNPQKEVFPPLRLLLKLNNRQETPNRTPWWLLLLRLAMAALVIFALADPVWRPQPAVLAGTQPLALIIDNGWASAPDWQKRVDVADDLLNQAAKLQKTVYLLATADNDNQDLRPLSADAAKQALHNIQSRPLPTHRLSQVEKLLAVTKGQTIDIAFLSDGLKNVDDQKLIALIEQTSPHNVLWYQSDISMLIGLTALKNESGAIAVDLIRAVGHGEKNLSLGAYDLKNRRIGDTQARFEDGEITTLAAFNLPLELRNDVVSIAIDSQNTAAGTYLVDGRSHIYRVALLSTTANEMSQPLLSPLYYVAKALQGNVDLVTAGSGAFSNDVDKLLAQNPSVFILGDVVNMPKETEVKLTTFVQNGGTLIRFAGENLAGAEHDDSLLPVQLRHGERQLGGVMSWAAPQKLAPFAKDGLFAGIAFPEDVTVSRQILAEPGPALFDRTWLSLADGTPLITAANRGNGKLIFIHTSADPTWSTLPLSGFFVEMLQKLVQLGAVKDNSIQQNNESLARQPWRTLDAEGRLEQPPSYVSPLILNDQTPALPSFNHPPGLYGTEKNVYAVNLLDSSSTLLPIEGINLSSTTRLFNYTADQQFRLAGFLFAAAVLLFAIDSVLVLWMSGLLRLKRRSLVLLGLGLSLPLMMNSFAPSPAHAQTLSKEDAAMVQSAGKTRLAYVITGNSEIDDTSKTGLESLSQFIQTRTTIDPGPVAGLDLDKDELAFYPLIYWPIDADTALPTQKSIEKINAFMRQGGTVLFDTRDQITAGLDLKGSATPNTQRLRTILDGLNIPALEQAPPDHVISRSFFIMPDFPGRYRGSPLWIESSAMGTNDTRPIHAGDGVSAILITANDLAGAWSHDGKGAWKYPLVPDDQMQRVWAFRGGLNIVMYMLTGNYKADQVHVPALLERLGREKQQ